MTTEDQFYKVNPGEEEKVRPTKDVEDPLKVKDPKDPKKSKDD